MSMFVCLEIKIFVFVFVFVTYSSEHGNIRELIAQHVGVIFSLSTFTECDLRPSLYVTLTYTGIVRVQDRVVRPGLHVDARSCETVWLEAEHGRDRSDVARRLHHTEVRIHQYDVIIEVFQ